MNAVGIKTIGTLNWLAMLTKDKTFDEAVFPVSKLKLYEKAEDKPFIVYDDIHPISKDCCEIVVSGEKESDDDDCNYFEHISAELRDDGVTGYVRLNDKEIVLFCDDIGKDSRIVVKDGYWYVAYGYWSN